MGLNIQISFITDIDKLIHEPARMVIMIVLYAVAEADFVFLTQETGLTHGNLSSHLSKLEDAGYVRVKKEFVDKKPRTVLSLTLEGRKAFRDYRQTLQRLLDTLPQ